MEQDRRRNVVTGLTPSIDEDSGELEVSLAAGDTDTSDDLALELTESLLLG